MEQNDNQEQRESRVIKNLDKLGLPLRDRQVLGMTVWIRRIDDVGLKDWAKIDALEAARHTARSARSELFRQLAGENPDTESIRESIQETYNAESSTVKGLLAIYIHHDGSIEDMDEKLSESFLIKAENITDAQIAALSSAFMMRPLEVGETEETQGLTQEMFPSSSDSTEETQSDG